MTTNEATKTTNENLPATKSSASKAVESLIGMCEERFTPVLGHGSAIDWATFALGVRAACLKNPGLLPVIQQSPGPLIQALSQAAALGLSPHPDLHHFYLVPFKGQIQALIGYRGLIELAMRSGLVEDVQAFVLYRDEVEAMNKAGLPLIDPATGEPNIHPDNRLLDGVKRTDDDIVGAIALVRSKGRSRPITQAMTKDQIEKRRMAGQGNTPAWKNWYSEMACKTVMRSLLRSGRIPLGKQADAIRQAMEEEIRPAQAEVVEAPRRQLEHHPDETERRHADPLPDPEQVRAELVDDVRRAIDMAGIDEEALSVRWEALELPACGIEELETPDLRKLLGAIQGDD